MYRGFAQKDNIDSTNVEHVISMKDLLNQIINAQQAQQGEAAPPAEIGGVKGQYQCKGGVWYFGNDKKWHCTGEKVSIYQFSDTRNFTGKYKGFAW